MIPSSHFSRLGRGIIPLSGDWKPVFSFSKTRTAGADKRGEAPTEQHRIFHACCVVIQLAVDNQAKRTKDFAVFPHTTVFFVVWLPHVGITDVDLSLL